MRIVDATNKELMQVASIAQDGDALVIKGKIFGTMPMTAKLTPEEARKALKLLNVKLIFFLITFLFRSTKKPKERAHA